MKNKEIRKLIILIILYYLIANFLHPATPAFFQSLQLPNYMFGVAFACMMTPNFLFSPFWGVMCNRYGSGKIIGLCLIGYAIGQFFMMNGKSSIDIAFARFFSGIFTGGITVGQIVYNMNHSSIEEKGPNLALAATVMAIFSAFGYMIGGYLGDYSIRFDFLVQIGGLLGLGILHLVLLKETITNTTQLSFGSIVKEANPFRSLSYAKPLLTRGFVLFLLVAFFSNFGTTCFDQVFNYFIRDQFGFPPSYNGLLKGLVGIITLIMNSTICIYLMRNTNVYRSIIAVFFICGFTLLGVISLKDVIPFIIVAIVFFGFNAVYKPLQQSMITGFGKQEDTGTITGVYNAIMSLGAVFGALVAGLFYNYNPRLPFVLAMLTFFLSMIISYMNRNHAKV